jgi:hypothetical protein
MKYTRLSKEQFESLHNEFINFLASQQITKNEWDDIKQNKPEIVEQELDIFSDLIWEGVLKQCRYIEHLSKNQMHLFFCDDDQMRLIGIKINNNTIDITTKEGYNWLRNNLMHDSVDFVQADKSYSDDANSDKFKLIQQGGVITKGALFQYFDALIG